MDHVFPDALEKAAVPQSMTRPLPDVNALKQIVPNLLDAPIQFQSTAPGERGIDNAGTEQGEAAFRPENL